MILEGERTGKLNPSRIILDSTSGNTGIAYAMVAAARGYKVKLCLPQNASPERKKILKAYGAELVLTDPGPRAPTVQSASAARSTKRTRTVTTTRINTITQPTGRRIMSRQASKIIEQTAGRITHFLAGMGTSGTFRRSHAPAQARPAHVQCISMQPSTGFSRPRGLEAHAHGDRARHLRRVVGGRERMDRDPKMPIRWYVGQRAKKAC
jgi:cysteine synthase B